MASEILLFLKGIKLALIRVCFNLFGSEKAGPEAKKRPMVDVVHGLGLKIWTVCFFVVVSCMVGIHRGVEICKRRLKVWYKYRPRYTITRYFVNSSNQKSEYDVITIVNQRWNEW